MSKMKKKVDHAFGKDIYFLGKDSEGTNYWLEAASWDCGWYWGFGYVETYTNNNNPSKSRDIKSHSHFDSMLGKNWRDEFSTVITHTPLSDHEVWKLRELMKSFYVAREYSDFLHIGGAHYTNNPCKDIIKNDEEYTRINTIVIPEICNKVYELLSPSDES